MRFSVWLAAPALSALLLLTGVLAAKTAPLHRDLLRATVRMCVAAQRNVGLPFPCESVDLGGDGRPGTALLRAPGARTHFLLTPVGDLSGLEAPQLQGADGVALFRAAWAARADVVAASARPLALTDVGVAVNSPMARSQDHLHIHLDCIRATTRKVLDEAVIGEDWVWLPASLDGRRYLARRVPAAGVAAFNPFASLARRLPAPKLIFQASFGVVPASHGDDILVLADIRPNAMAERLLDHRCGA